MQKEKITLIVEKMAAGMRIDKFINRYLPTLSFMTVSQLLRKNIIKINKKKHKNTYIVLEGDSIDIYGYATKDIQDKPKLSKTHITIAQNLIDTMLYKDDDILIINKPPKIAVQGGKKVSISIDDLSELLNFDLISKPKLVHRLDRDTSGAMMLARNDIAAKNLCKMFQEKGSITKRYLALCNGSPIALQGTINIPLKKLSIDGIKEMMCYSEYGDEAITHYKVLSKTATLSLIQFTIVTGRTHQVRAHCAISGLPIVGDKKYNLKYFSNIYHDIAPHLILNQPRNEILMDEQLYLHSFIIELNYFGKKISVKAPLPEYFANAIQQYNLNL